VVPDFVLEMTGHAGLQHIIHFWHDLLKVLCRNDASQFFGRFVMGHRQIVVGGREILRLLQGHRLTMHEESEVRFGQAFRQLIVFFDQRVDDRLNGL